MAAFKQELTNAQLNADDSGQSTVAGPGETEFKISETFEKDTYFRPAGFEAITTQELYVQQHITQETVPIYYVNTVI